MLIESENIYLRPLTRKDATQRYADWLNDEQVNAFLETRHVQQTMESCKSFVEKCNASPSENLFGVFYRDGDVHVGNAKLGSLHDLYARAQISLFIGERDYWGRGLGSEVILSLTRFGFENLMLERIEAGVYEQNLASLRAFLNVGYTVEGYLRKHVMFNGRRSGCFWLAMLKNEF